MVDPFAGWGLRPVSLADRGTFDAYFGTLSEPISDYTFSQFYTWRNSLRIVWKEIEGNLCVFANGAGDLTLLAPPIGDDARTDRALREAYGMMDEYNAAKGVPERSRVEYVSEEVMRRIVRTGVEVRPLGMDYVYDVRRMIDLAGGDLASKRQAKNRFMRNYRYRVEAYDRVRHLGQCLMLLGEWKEYQDANHARGSVSGGTEGDCAEPAPRPSPGVPGEGDTRGGAPGEGGEEAERVRVSAAKREKESLAAELTLDAAEQLGMRGMVVYVEEGGASDQGQGARGERVRGFTLGEWLGSDQSSITIEKTDLRVKGLAQFIFSEFCAREWQGRGLVNVGDDWGLESLAWTKMSYRPVKLLQKYVLRKARAERVAVGESSGRCATRPDSQSPAPSPARMEGLCGRGVEALRCAQSDGREEARSNEGAAERSGGGIVLRPAVEGDLAAALELERTCFTAHSLKRRQLQYLRGRRSAIFLVAEEGGRVIGDGIALMRRHKGGVASGRIYSLAVAAAQRGKGIGRRLLEAMVASLAERGVRRVYLEVEEANAGAVRLYESCGFARIGALADYYGAGRAGIHMVREIPREEPVRV